jgi:hypothetical protein
LFSYEEIRGDIIINPSDTFGDLVFNSTNIESGFASDSASKYLRIKLNGAYYKIALLAE